MGRKPMADTWVSDPRVFGSQNTWSESRTRGTTRMFDGSGQLPADITIKYVAFHKHCLTKGDIPHLLVVTRLTPPPHEGEHNQTQHNGWCECMAALLPG